MSDSVLTEGEWSPPVASPVAVPHWASWGAAFLALLASTLWLASAAKSLQRPLETIVVRGTLTHIHATDVAAAMHLPVGTPWKSVDLARVRASVEAMPWVADARVSRQWPDTIIVSLSERVPFARWGDHQMIDTQGGTFEPGAVEVAMDLPQLAGVAGHEQEVMDEYSQLSRALAGTPFALAGVAQDARGDWVGATHDGISIRFGAGNPADKISMLTGAVARTLAGKLDQVAYIDLRYTNGFAVGWRTPPDAARPNKEGASP